MIVSWNWLAQYVLLDMPLEELEERLTMSGLNHEGTEEIGGDLAIDLEVTSNRPDCLGHLGVAREVAVLWGHHFNPPPARCSEADTPIGELVKVRIDCPQLCRRYTARVIRGVRVGPSPRWVVRRLETVGLTAINNIVDISNYVLMECGQPLHAFDLAKLKGPEIIVRQPRSGETIEAIDHKTYPLEAGMCIIADAEDAVAIGGVMGGAASEVSESTTDVLIEAAEFDPVSIRNSARRLNLHSESSYRFERQVDPEGIDWASRRCAELILELAGGRLCQGVLDVGRRPPRREPIVLRLAQLERVLGIEVPSDRVRKILADLGNIESKADARQLEVIPPSWRRDLTREIDLVEEVARIHGYDEIPEDVSVPMVSSTRTRQDRVLAKVRRVLTAWGSDEAMTPSVVDQEASDAFSPWTEVEPLRSLTPVLRGADRLRRSLIPSLLAARRTNEAVANPRIELFEIAKVYLPRENKLPAEELMLGITSGRQFVAVKGLVEAVVAALNRAVQLEAADACCDLLDPRGSCRMSIDGEVVGYVGQLLPEALKRLNLRQPSSVAEVRLAPLVRTADLVPRHVPQSPYPAVSRDLNLVVDETVRWADVAVTVRENCREYFEDLEYCDTYRDPQRFGTEKKSLLMTITLRRNDGTMTNQEADRIRERIVAACHQKHGAELR